jgi:hypothetical protein
MAWPLSQDYNEAIQDAQSSFSDPELKAGEATTNALGMPMPRSGNFADVYEFNTPAIKSKWAIKCFTRHVPGLRERYTEISAGLLAAKLPFAVDFQYLVQGIRVRGDWFPILKMRWVEGFLLNEFVRDNLDKPALLGNLGLIWSRMAKRLREASIAHADLQHGNVILVSGSKASSLAVKLIDYDGMYVPALAAKKSGEVGHPNYQHPQRLREGIYNAEVDRFPLLVVATALRALSVGGRELWDRYDNGDNLLFRETDLQAPDKSALFAELHKMADPQARMLTEELHKSVEHNLADVPRIDELLPELKTTKAASKTAVKPVEEAPLDDLEEIPDEAAATPAGAALDFGASSQAAPKRKASGGVPTWAWIAGGACALAVVGVAVLGAAIAAAVMLGGDKNKDGPIAQDGPARTKEPKANPGADPDKDQKKEKAKAPTNGPFDHLVFNGAAPAGGHLRLMSDPQAWIETKDSFSGPIEITVVARTEKTSIRLHAFNGACVIFNWEDRRDELRVNRPDGSDKKESGSLIAAKARALDPNTWYTLRWRITEHGMQIFLDDQEVFSEQRKYNLSANRPVSITTAFQPIDVKSVTVKRLEATPSPSKATELRITVTIDGKDTLRITPTEMRWTHHSYLYPTHVKLNDFDWDPKKTPVLTSDLARLLGADVELSKAKLTKIRGRGPVTLQIGNGFIVVVFNDEQQLGADTYEISLTFPPAIKADPAPPIIVTDGFAPLFDGKTLNGWEPLDREPGQWRVENGALTGKGHGYIVTTRSYSKDFHLRVEGRFAGAESYGAVLWRATPDFQGYEVIVNRATANNVGSMQLRTQGLSASTGTGVPVAPGEWFVMDILAVGKQVTVKVNGKIATDYLDTDNDFKIGQVALRHPAKGLLEFRKIEIKELKPEAAPPIAVTPGFVPLFNGKNLAGWESHGNQKGDWQVLNGVLTGNGPFLKMLATTRDDYADLHLRMETRINADASGSVMFRYPHGPAQIAKLDLGGYAVRLFGKVNDLGKTGQLIAYEKIGSRQIAVKQALAKPNDWFLLEVIAQGDNITTLVNGTEAVKFKNPKTDIKTGRIVLEANSTANKTVVEFRKIEVKEFKAATPVAVKKGFSVEVPAESKGVWRIEKDELVQANAGAKVISQIFFGAPQWTDYDFEVQVMRGKPDGWFTIFSRHVAKDSHFYCRLSTNKGSTWARGGWHDAGKVDDRNVKDLKDTVQPNVWYTAKFSLRGDNAECYLDGVKLYAFPAEKFRAGKVGLETFGSDYRFKNIKVSAPDGTVLLEGLPDLAPAPVPDNFVPLITPDLSKWRPNPRWRVEDGVLTAPAASAPIQTVSDYKDFHLRFEVRVKTTGSIKFRSSGPFGAPSYSLDMRPPPGKVKLTRNIAIGETGSKSDPLGPDVGLPAGDWVPVEILAAGNQLTVKFNGDVKFKTADATARSGTIVLSGGANKCEFRKIEIKELAAP